MTTRSAWGLGLATVTDDGNTLDVWYPRPVLGDEPEEGHADLLASLSAMERRDEARGVHTTVVRTWADLDDAPPDRGRRLPAPAHTVPPPGQAQHRQSGRDLLPPSQRGVDLRGPLPH